MSYFTRIEALPKLDLQQQLNQLIADGTVSWPDKINQICLNTIAGHEDDYILGTGSLTHDWENGVVSIDEYGNQKTIIKEKENQLQLTTN